METNATECCAAQSVAACDSETVLRQRQWGSLDLSASRLYGNAQLSMGNAGADRFVVCSSSCSNSQPVGEQQDSAKEEVEDNFY